MLEGNIRGTLRINDPNILRFYNLSALRMEESMNRSFVVGNKEELSWLQELNKKLQ